MLGISFQELIQAVSQVGAAVAGASAFFGFYFLWRAENEKKLEKEYYAIAQSLLIPLLIGLVIFFFAWGILFFAEKLTFIKTVSAHEGITIERTPAIVESGKWATFPFVAGLFMLNIGAFFLCRLRKRPSFLKLFFGLNVLLIGEIMFFMNYVDATQVKQFFVGLHGIHSIWTIGAATIVDYLYIKSLKASDSYQAATYLSFPLLTTFIWTGLALDGISSIGLIREHLDVTPKFFFMQTIIAILIINGVFLTRTIGNELTAQARKGVKVQINPKLSRRAILLGSISIVSWYTITMVDFFEHITLSYNALLLTYISAIGAAFLVGYLIEKNVQMR